ncbi:MAG: tetratricopeptide repeat protein [candidate division WOR-3 bacterium]
MGFLALGLFISLSSSIGDSLYLNRDYFNAITEYKRSLFYGDQDSIILLRKIALSYYKRGKFEDAMEYYSRAYYNAGSREIGVLFALASIRAGIFQSARLILEDQVDSFSLILKAVSFGLSEEYDSANKILISLGYPVPTELRRKKVIELASRFIPGLGLLFIGDFSLFCGTLIASGAGGYLTYYYVKRRLYYEAVTSGIPLFLRFYNGGQWNTRTRMKIAVRKYFTGILKVLEDDLLEREERSLFNQK